METFCQTFIEFRRVIVIVKRTIASWWHVMPCTRDRDYVMDESRHMTAGYYEV